MDKLGVIHGRFQVLHNDHLHYLLEGKKRCEQLIIGICNPEVDLVKYTSANPHRSKKSANPLTYYERAACIRLAMLEAGILRNEFEIVPFPINYPEKIFNYAPIHAKYYLSIYDQWGEEKYKLLTEDLHLDVEVIRRVPLTEKGLSSSDLRRKICERKPWAHLVPSSVYAYLLENQLDKRISKFLEKEMGKCSKQ